MGYELIHHRVTQGITEFNQFEIKRIELRETLCYSVVKTHYFSVLNYYLHHPRYNYLVERLDKKEINLS